MSANKYNIREICGDWALDMQRGNKTITLFFNSRNNAELVKAILEWEDNHPNEAAVVVSGLAAAAGNEKAAKYYELFKAGLDALRPVSRKQVEKVWRGEWMALDECSNEGVYCKRCKKKVYRIEYANEKMRSPFCPACGSPMTDEAVEITMRRLEALKDGKDD